MTAERQLQEIEKLNSESFEIMKSKGKDYASEDILSNFKRLSSIVKALNLSLDTPVGYSLFMILLKIDRINNLVSSGKEPNNESVEDSYKDGINYFKLSYLNYIESKEKV